MNRRTITIIVVIIGLGIAGGLLLYAGMNQNERRERNENKQTLATTELPAAVQKTIQDNLAGGTINETAKETEGGTTFYDAEVQRSGSEKVEIKVAEDGKLIGITKAEEDDD